MISLSILFSGRCSNALSILNNIVFNKLNFKVKNIVCNKKDAPGINLIKECGFIPKILDINSYIDKTKYNIELGKILNPEDNDLLLLCGYMSKLPDHIIKSYNGNVINIHPSLLPKYKGLNTHKNVIFNKDKFHGCTTHYVTNNIDCGPIIAQFRIPVESSDDEISIAKKLLPNEHKLYFNTLKFIERGKLNLLDNEIFFDGKLLKDPIRFT